MCARARMSMRASILSSALMSPGRQQVGQLGPQDKEFAASSLPPPAPAPSSFPAMETLLPHVSISGADVGRVVEEGAFPS